MSFCYEYQCPTCKDQVWEEQREMFKRNFPAICPKCGRSDCKKIMSRTNFNAVFQGSTRAEHLADQLTRESVEAQEEGFTSKDELQTAIGLAEERAKQMGQPGKKLIGPVESPFVGEKYNPSADEVKVADDLVKRQLKAASSGDARGARVAAEALKEHETVIKGKVAKKQQDFIPKNTKEQLKKNIKLSQESRGARA